MTSNGETHSEPEGLPPHAAHVTSVIYLSSSFFLVKADISMLFVPLEFISSLFSFLYNKQVHKYDRTA